MYREEEKACIALLEKPPGQAMVTEVDGRLEFRPKLSVDGDAAQLIPFYVYRPTRRQLILPENNFAFRLGYVRRESEQEVFRDPLLDCDTRRGIGAITAQ